MIARVWHAHQEVFAKSSLKQAVVLLQIPDVIGYDLPMDLGQVQPINQHATGLRLIESAEHAKQ